MVVVVVVGVVGVAHPLLCRYERHSTATLVVVVVAVVVETEDLLEAHLSKRERQQQGGTVTAGAPTARRDPELYHQPDAPDNHGRGHLPGVDIGGQQRY